MIYALIITSLALALSVYITRNLFAPATIVSALWLFSILAFQFYPHDLVDLSNKFYTGISIWVTGFTLSSLFIQGLRQTPHHTKEPSMQVRNLLFLLTIITFPYILKSILSLLESDDFTENIYSALRHLAVTGKSDGGATSKNYFAPLWLVAYSIELLHFRKKRWWILLILFAVNFSWGVLTVAKSDFLNLFVATLAILFFKRMIKTKTILIALSVIFVFFSTLQVIRTMGADKRGEELQYDFFTQYVLSGMPAFETVKAKSSDYFGEQTFRTFYSARHRMGLSKREGADSLQEFILVDKKKQSHTNIYTVIYPYYKDFGYPGIILFSLIVGAFFGHLFKQKTLNNNPLTISYALLSVGLILQFMSELHFTAMSYIIQVLIISHLPYWLTNRKSLANE